VAQEEAGINDGSGDRRSRERRVESDGVESDEDLESFGMKNKTTWDGVLFIGSKLSAAVLI
jgi:hypothetical protein